MANSRRPSTPMWKAGVLPKSKRYSKGGKLNNNKSKENSTTKKKK